MRTVVALSIYLDYVGSFVRIFDCSSVFVGHAVVLLSKKVTPANEQRQGATEPYRLSVLGT